MSKYIFLISTTIFLFSCKQETPRKGSTSGSNKDLENRVAQLELDNALKDSVINESLLFFNEIKSNLEAISIRKDQIMSLKDNPEISNDDKKWIIEEIRHINFLREDNARKVNQLKSDLKKNGLKIAELEIMIESLMKDIQWKDQQISLLQNELNHLDREYAALFDAYQEQAIKVDELTSEMNTVYYAYGTENELSLNKVIEKRNGFIGIGKKAELREHFNDKYFTAIDGTRVKDITVEGTKIRLITSHPSDSYSMEIKGNSTKVHIKDPSEFWKVSRYMVAITE